MLELAGKKIVIAGLGRTGVAVAKFLVKRHAMVTITDLADEEKLAPFIAMVRKLDIEVQLGEHKNKTFENADLVIVSPGVPHTISPILRATAKNIPVMGEIELAYRFIEEPIVAVTGTNGKTTTTELIGKMLLHSGIKTFVGGNIGNPLIGYVDQGEKAQVIVAEVSSFQLDTIETFTPKVGVLLNITDDHLDRYKDFNAYAAAKARLFMNQGPADVAVLNRSDPFIHTISKQVKSRKWYFNLEDENEEGALIQPDKIILRFHPNHQQWIDTKDIRLLGRHNVENICAASLGALAADGTVEGIQFALKQFNGLAHRLEYVDSINGVKYVDDSKATNVDSVKKALETFENPIVLIMGGQDKGGNFQTLRNCLSRRAKKLIVMGEAKDIISSALEGTVPITPSSGMEDAVIKAREASASGDVVILSPGCSSFDMYENYARRGESFRQAVKQVRLKTDDRKWRDKQRGKRTGFKI